MVPSKYVTLNPHPPTWKLPTYLSLKEVHSLSGIQLMSVTLPLSRAMLQYCHRYQLNKYRKGVGKVSIISWWRASFKRSITSKKLYLDAARYHDFDDGIRFQSVGILAADPSTIILIKSKKCCVTTDVIDWK